jgi:hypothetical protein
MVMVAALGVRQNIWVRVDRDKKSGRTCDMSDLHNRNLELGLVRLYLAHFQYLSGSACTKDE